MLTPNLKRLKEKLEEQRYLTEEEKQILKELTQIDNVPNVIYHSLAIADNRCPTCGKPL